MEAAEALSTWIDEAVESVNKARLQSVYYRDTLEQILHQTRRNVRQVDWRNEVPRLLSEALEHIKVRCAVEGDIAAKAREKLDHLPPGSNEADRVTTVARLAEDCYQHHVELHRLLMQARGVFLDEQERQCFIPESLKVSDN